MNMTAPTYTGLTVTSTAGGTNGDGQTLILSSPSVSGTGGLLLSQLSSYTSGKSGFKFYCENTGSHDSDISLASVDLGSPDTLVNKAMTATYSGALSSAYNTLDDGTGNMTLAAVLKLPCVGESLTAAQLEPYLWQIAYQDNAWVWTANQNTLPLGASKIRFVDTGDSNNYVDIGTLRVTDMAEHDVSVYISQHLFVKKDFSCGGSIYSYQGALILGSDYATDIANGQMPQIILANSEIDPHGGSNYRNTLQIWRNNNYGGFGNLEIANLTTHGFISCGAISNSGDMIPTAGGTYYCGTNNYPWLAVNTQYVFLNYINSLSVSPIIIYPNVQFNGLINTSYKNAYFSSSNVLGYSGSSIRFKENIRDLPDSSWIYKLKPKMFDWKDQTREKNQIGLIAEDVNVLCPQLVWLDEQGFPEGIHYEWLSVPLLAEVQRLHSDIENLRSQIDGLKNDGAGAS
jgi:hypothetical protein